MRSLMSLKHCDYSVAGCCTAQNAGSLFQKVIFIMVDNQFCIILWRMLFCTFTLVFYVSVEIFAQLAAMFMLCLLFICQKSFTWQVMLQTSLMLEQWFVLWF